MVQASIDNTSVSISLGSGESTTVPTGETWRVTLASDGEFQINGTAVAPPNLPTVVTGGDTIKGEDNAGSGTRLHIGGFKV